MKASLKFPDSGLLITLILCSFALLPLLRESGLPAGYDVLYHTYRVAEMDRSWEAGVFLPRWADSFYFGYGYPVFHYYASSTYYLTSLMIAATGISAINALRAVILIALLGGGAGMYLFNRGRWGQIGGLLAGLVYVYSPYILYTEPYTRGDYPELLAFALFPWLLWRYDQLAHHPQQRRNIVFAVITLALLIITHNLMALVFTGMLGAWLVWLRMVRAVDWQTWLILLGAAALGVGLAGYFWIPVLLERDAVQLENLIDVAELDYRNFFVPLNELTSLTPRADGGALNGLIPRYKLGVAAWTLGLAGGISLAYGLFRRDASPRLRVTGLFAIMGGLMIFLMTPQAEGVWKTITPLAYLQFPWRFLGPTAACLAILAAANVYWLERLPQKILPVVLAALCLLPLVFAIPTFYVPQWDLKNVDTSVAAYQQAEVLGLQRGTTFTGEFLPKDVFVVPNPNQRLLADFADGRPVDKVHREALPDGVQVEVIDQNPHHNEWRIEANAPFQIEILTFDFVGWEASINGSPVEITPSVPHGLITFPVPAGESVVRLDLKNTPPRNLGYVVSAVSLLGLVGLAFIVGHRTGVYTDAPLPSYPVSQLWIVCLLTLVIFVPVLAVLMRPGWAWLDSEAGEALAAEHRVQYELGEEIALLGYDLSASELSAGGRLEIALYWYARQKPTAGYASFIHISTGGPPLAQSDRLNPGGVPTLTWTTDGYLYDSHVIYLPEWMPAGEYQISVGMWTCDGIPEGQECGNGIRPTVTDADGNVLGDTVPLAKLVVK